MRKWGGTRQADSGESGSLPSCLLRQLDVFRVKRAELSVSQLFHGGASLQVSWCLPPTPLHTHTKNLEIYAGQDKTRMKPTEEAGTGADSKVPLPGALYIRSTIVLFPAEDGGVTYVADPTPNLLNHTAHVMDSLGLSFS